MSSSLNARTRMAAGVLAGALAFGGAAWAVENGNHARLEAIGTDWVGAAPSRSYSGIGGTLAVGSTASGTSRNGEGLQVVVGPATVGAAAAILPPPPEDILESLLKKSPPPADADFNHDGAVDAADLIRLMQ